MKLFGFTFIVVVLLLGMVFPVSADPTKIVPFISLVQEYSDNILFSASNEEEDFITTVSGGLAIKYKTQVINAGLEARLDQALYKDFDELNALDKFLSGNVSYKATERLGIGAMALLSEDFRRDREIETTGLLISGERKTMRFSFHRIIFFLKLQGVLSHWGMVLLKLKRQTVLKMMMISGWIFHFQKICPEHSKTQQGF